MVCHPAEDPSDHTDIISTARLRDITIFHLLMRSQHPLVQNDKWANDDLKYQSYWGGEEYLNPLYLNQAKRLFVDFKIWFVHRLASFRLTTKQVKQVKIYYLKIYLIIK